MLPLAGKRCCLGTMLRRISLIVIFAGVLAGQSGGPVSFESADVRISPQKPNLTTVGGVLRVRRYEFRNATLIDLISNAYGIPPNRVRGDLTWLLWDRFDVSAVAPADVSLDAAKVMLRTLLAERFKLVIHDGSAPLPLYALTAGKGVVHFREGNPV